MVTQPGSALRSHRSCWPGVTGPKPLPAHHPLFKLGTCVVHVLQAIPTSHLAQACGAPAVEQQKESWLDILGRSTPLSVCPQMFSLVV